MPHAPGAPPNASSAYREPVDAVRVVVTASGRVTFEGANYGPEGAVVGEHGAAIDGQLRHELERALVAASRANNAGVEQRDKRWMIQGDPTEGALLVAAGKAGIDRRRSTSSWHA